MTEDGQVADALGALQAIAGPSLRAVYLHGSAVSGGLRPQSDIDLLAIVEPGLTADQRERLLAALLRLSGRYPAARGGPRCLEMMVFSRSALASCLFPVRADFLYGEWLRRDYEAGAVPEPDENPEYTLVLAQARQEAVALFGPQREALLPAVPALALQQAMCALIPGLLASLPHDTRNVLLTLARMWRTAATGDFVPKDVAAHWAASQVSRMDGVLLEHARLAYLGEASGDWSARQGAARRLAGRLAVHTKKALDLMPSAGPAG